MSPPPTWGLLGRLVRERVPRAAPDSKAGALAAAVAASSGGVVVGKVLGLETEAARLSSGGR